MARGDPHASILAPWLAGDIQAPDGPVSVEKHHETHTCFILLDATRAYKLRKPVDLGFLDYRTRIARWDTTRQECDLGERISPHTYQGVWSLSRDGSGVLDPQDTTGEPVLVMRRLPAELCAEHLFADLQVPAARFDPALEQCARFHFDSPVDRSRDGWGAVANTVAAWSVNWEQMSADDSSLQLFRAERQLLIAETDQWLATIEPLLLRRIAAGRIREGHGDLRLQHVYLTEPWSVIDPLEFSRALRFCDVAAEICFLAMELDEMGRPEVAAHVLQRYAELTDDDSLLQVAPFFKRYRAVVRAKVEWIRAGQVGDAARAEHLQCSRNLFELALNYTI